VWVARTVSVTAARTIQLNVLGVSEEPRAKAGRVGPVASGMVFVHVVKVGKRQCVV